MYKHIVEIENNKKSPEIFYQEINQFLEEQKVKPLLKEFSLKTDYTQNPVTSRIKLKFDSNHEIAGLVTWFRAYTKSYAITHKISSETSSTVHICRDSENLVYLVGKDGTEYYETK